MKNRKFTRFCTLILAFCMILSLVPSTSPAVHAEGTTKTSAQSTKLDGQISAEPVIFDTAPEIDASLVPEIIGVDAARERNHVFRLPVEESNDLNKVVFQNLDGTKTMYLFDFPVKYVNADGDIADISLEIEDGTTAEAKFKTKSNTVQTQFPEYMHTGVRLQGNGVDVTLVPAMPQDSKNTNHKVSRLDSKTVGYFYDSKTVIEYSLTYTGFKEDIVVSEYTGQTEYTFTLHTNGLTLTQIDGSFYLTDAAGQIRGTLGDIIVFTADERNNTLGRMEAETVTANQEYLLTIILDAEYLADPDTAYPIRIDPTIEVNYDSNGTGGILDITTGPSRTFSGTSGSLYVGKHSSYGICRALMQFPDLTFDDISDSSKILSATVEIRDLLCETTSMTLECHIYKGTTWTESGATYHTGSYTTPMSSQTISYSNGRNLQTKHRYSFDITAAVKLWMNLPSSKSQGILFKASSAVENGSSSEARTFASYNRANYKPSLKVNYQSSVTLTCNEDYVSSIPNTSFPITATLANDITVKTIEWTSSSINIAEVVGNEQNLTATVTSKKPGKATITIVVTDQEDIEHSASYEVYVHFINGIYRIKQNGFAYYAGIDNGSLADDSPAVLQSNASATSDDYLYQTWRLTYLGSGYYSIRPVYWEQLVLYANGTDVEVHRKNVSSDTLFSLTVYEQWSISYSSSSYTIKNRGNGKCIQPAGSTRANGTELVVNTHSSGDTTFRWAISSASPLPNAVFLYDTENRCQVSENTMKYINYGTTKSLSDLGLAVQVCESYSTNQNASWTSNTPAIATVNTSTGAVTAVSCGPTTITMTRSVGGTTVTKQYSLTVILPLSGSELPYEPDFWNLVGDIMFTTNCYAYAFNNQQDEMNPGSSSGYELPQLDYTVQNVRNSVEADAAALGVIFEYIEKDEACPAGSYKVALFIDPNVDHHWYRQNPDGTWSHKLSTNPVCNVDASGNIIYDPETANRAYSNLLDYDQLVGFFRITPLNKLYTEED